MTRANQVLVVAVVATLGIWGCAQEQSHNSGSARLRALESKNAKLEEDFRAVVAAREQLRKQLLTAQAQQAHLSEQIEQIQVISKERDELKQQVSVRTQERDALQGQFEQFRKGLRNLLGQADSACNGSTAQPVTAAPAVRVEEKS